MDDNYYDIDTQGKKWTAGRIVKTVIKGIVIAIAMTFLGLFLVRACMQQDTATAKRYVWNEDAVAAYSADPEGFAVYELPSNNTYEIDNIFTISSVRMTPKLGQLQFSLRWNTAFVESLLEEIEIPEDELFGDELFLFALKDDAGNWYTDYEYVTDSRFMYEYRRLVFSDINYEDITSLTLYGFCIIDGMPSSGGYCDSALAYSYADARRVFDVKKEAPKNGEPTKDLLTVSFDIR